MGGGASEVGPHDWDISQTTLNASQSIEKDEEECEELLKALTDAEHVAENYRLQYTQAKRDKKEVEERFEKKIEALDDALERLQTAKNDFRDKHRACQKDVTELEGQLYEFQRAQQSYDENATPRLFLCLVFAGGLLWVSWKYVALSHENNTKEIANMMLQQQEEKKAHAKQIESINKQLEQYQKIC